MVFKQNQTVVFKKPVTSHDGAKVAGLGTMGIVTVVGIEMPDGNTDGIEVLADGDAYFHCYPREVDVLGHKDDARDLSHLIEDRPAELKKFRTDDPLLAAREAVHRIFYGPSSETPAAIEDVYIVWFASVLSGWKALISTNVKDNSYYEVTHNGPNNETYVDHYVKHTHAAVRHNDGRIEMNLIDNF